MTGFHPNYIDAAIAGESSKLASAANGERNQILFASSCSLAGLGIREGDIIRILKPSADKIGLKGGEFYSTVKSGVKAGYANPRSTPPSSYEHRARAATTPPPAVSDQSIPEVTSGSDLPVRTMPDRDGKPAFIRASGEGPQASHDEIRRHIYLRNDVPVRIKIKRAKGFVNWYRVADAEGEGWQAAKPNGYVPRPYVGALDPFDSELAGDAVLWPEGEKDVDALCKLGLPAFTFGGTGDGLPDTATDRLRGRHVIILADNDAGGTAHAEKKAVAAHGVAASVKIVTFPELPPKGDVADFIALGGSADDLWQRIDGSAVWSPPAPPDQYPGGDDLVIRRLSDVTIEPIEHLWLSRFYVGKQSLLIGEQGIGKSQLTCYIAATVTNGDRWPCDEGRAPQGSVIFLSAEDNAADTIRPRCEAVNADLSRIHVISSVWVDDPRTDGKVRRTRGRRSFNLQADLAKLEAAIERIGDVRLVIIDPVSSYMGKVDGHSNTDVRGVLEPIGEMAARNRVCIISVTHKPKGKGNSAVNVGIGSVAFAAVARSAWLVERDPADRDHILFAQTKNNLAPDPGTLAFRIGSVQLDDGNHTSAVHFDPHKIDLSADDVLAANDSGQSGADKPARAEAEDFLRDFLAEGPAPQKDVKEQADAAGISWATIKRAKKTLGVKAERSGGLGTAGRWQWSLPNASASPKGLKNAYEAQGLNVSPLAESEPLSSDGGIR